MTVQGNVDATELDVALDGDQPMMIAKIIARATPAQEPPASSYDFDVSHDGELHQCNAVLNGYEIGRLDYSLTGDRIILISTVIVPGFQRHGIATELIGRALDDVRRTGETITVLCPVVRAFIDRYSQYGELVDLAYPGLPSTRLQQANPAEKEATHVHPIP